MTPSKTRKWPLTVKFALGTLTGLVGLSIFFLLLFVSVYKNAIESAHSHAADRVSSLLGITLKQAMLDRELHRLQPIIDGLAESEGVLSIRILSASGQIRFSNDPQEFGVTYQADVDTGCRECHSGTETRSTLLFTDDRGRDILRAVNPVANRPECGSCHPPVEKQPINGLLMVDYDGSDLRRQARDVAFLFVGAGLIVFLITVGGGTWFMRRFVLRPVGTLHAASQRLIDGDLEARVDIPGTDEFSALGHCFNDLTSQLLDSMAVLREKDAFLQGLVDAVPDGLRVIDQSYRILLTNATYNRQLSIDSGAAIGELCYASSHRRDTPCPSTLVRCPHEELFRGGEPFKSIHRHLRPDGHHIDVEVYAAPMKLPIAGGEQNLVVESIRDLKEQARFSHEQKLSELGQLAAGVAHEIFNPLSAAKMKLDATLAAFRDGRLDDQQLLAAMEVVDGEIGRGIETTDRLIKLSRHAGNSPTLVDLNAAVAETLSLLNNEAQHRGIEHRAAPLDSSRPRPDQRQRAASSGAQPGTERLSRHGRRRHHHRIDHTCRRLGPDRGGR